MPTPREVLDRVLAQRGLTRVDLPPRTALGKAVRRHGVIDSAEFKRIDALPRRVWSADPNLEEITDRVTEALITPQGRKNGVRLFPIQAYALLEAAEVGGLIGGLRTGSGKTLCSFLVYVLRSLIFEDDTSCDRPVLFGPAKLRDKTDADFRAAAVNWRVPEHLQFRTYEDLSNVKWCDWLMKYQPSAIGADEAHRLKNDDSARAVRFDRFLEEHPRPVFMFSGTFLRKELWELQQVCNWALGEGAPVPLTSRDCRDWVAALDPKARKPLAAGALARWGSHPRECDTLNGLRAAVGRRICETPGVVISNGKSDIAASLSLESKIVDFPECEEHMMRLKSLGEKPDGWQIIDAPVKWSVERQLARGFYYYPDPYPPQEWADAHREWNSFCIGVKAQRREGLDSELQIWNACQLRADNGEPLEVWERWARIKETFKLNKKAVWFSDVQLQRAAAWLEDHKGICWVSYVEYGERLSELTGFPYYRENGCDAQGNSIVYAKAGPVICSVIGCGEGLNLQDRWSENLYQDPMSNGAEWEQSMARTHRIFQPKDEVRNYVWLSARVDIENLTNAIATEVGTSILMQEPERKLVVADKILADERAIPRKTYRWR